MRQRVVKDESSNLSRNAAGMRMKAWQLSSRTSQAFLSVQHTLHCGGRFARSRSAAPPPLTPRAPQPHLASRAHVRLFTTREEGAMAFAVALSTRTASLAGGRCLKASVSPCRCLPANLLVADAPVHLPRSSRLQPLPCGAPAPRPGAWGRSGALAMGAAPLSASPQQQQQLSRRRPQAAACRLRRRQRLGTGPAAAAAPSATSPSLSRWEMPWIRCAAVCGAIRCGRGQAALGPGLGLLRSLPGCVAFPPGLRSPSSLPGLCCPFYVAPPCGYTRDFQPSTLSAWPCSICSSRI